MTVFEPARAWALAAVLLLLGCVLASPCGAQDVEVERPGPPARDDFETDKNKDGVPDGWYNARDVKIVAEGGVVGPHCLQFDCRKPGRPARLSRAFGIDGREHEAIIIGLWVRQSEVQTGERMGDEPGLILDFLGEGLRQQTRGLLGPWTDALGNGWVRVAKRIAVPPGARDAIMSVGLLGATGSLEIDGLTFELVPVGGKETTNLVPNGDFELGSPEPTFWGLEKGARRSFPKLRPCLELAKAGSRAITGLAIPVEPFGQLALTVAVQAHGLRGAGGAEARFFFLDNDGAPVPGAKEGIVAFNWSGSFDWRTERQLVRVPPGAVRAAIQFAKSDGVGSIHIDDVEVVAAPIPEAGSWLPDHVAEDTSDWSPVQPSKAIEAKSALDASYLLDAPAGKHGFVTVRDGRLAFSRGGRARFFGVALLPPSAFLEDDKADALADRLARSGINLVRLGSLDAPLGPDRSLFDDTRDDTKAFDPEGLRRLDHLIAALKKRGIYVSLELLSARRFRSDDGVHDPGLLPPGGGPAAVFDPSIGKLTLDSARALLAHVNPETGLALRADPVLAWVTLAGELTLFDLIDDPTLIPGSYAADLKEQGQKTPGALGRRFWLTLEAAHWKEQADALRADKLRVPVASVSHARRDPEEFDLALQAPGLDLIDDRLYHHASPWVGPNRRSFLWNVDGGLATGAARKRKTDRPYVVGQWAHVTQGAWSVPYEAADVMLAAATAVAEDWDALVRRGVFLFPVVWGANAVGTGGGEDIFQLPEVVNGMPQAYSLWPHAASIVLRGHKTAEEPAPARQPGRRRKPFEPIEGWDPTRGRLVIDTPYTQGIAGWPGGEPVNFESVTVDTTEPYAVVMASSAGKEPIARARRLLVTVVAKVVPTGFRWANEWRREVADPGRPPLLQDPVSAKVRWRRQGAIKAYALDNNGARANEVKLKEVDGGVELVIDGTAPTFHWELVVE